MARETTSEEVFEGLVEGYLANLGPTKRGKALIDGTLFAFILDTLRDPSDTTLGDSGERYWARAHFEFIRPPGDENGEVLGPNGDPLVRYFRINQRTRARTAEKPVAQRHEIYEIVKEAHERTNHGGRDKTYNAVKAEWSHIPKDLVTGFIKHCPACSNDREAGSSKAAKGKQVKLPTLNSLNLPLPPPPTPSANTVKLRPRKANSRPEEAKERHEPLGMAALLVAASALSSPPLPTDTAQDEQLFGSSLHSHSLVAGAPEHRWSSSSTSSLLHSPQQSPFRPMSLFDPLIKSSTSLLSEPLETSPTLSARQLTLTPASSNDGSSAQEGPLPVPWRTGESPTDFDPSFWLNDELCDDACDVWGATSPQALPGTGAAADSTSSPLQTAPSRPNKRRASSFDCFVSSSSAERTDEHLYGDEASDAPPTKRRRATCSPSYLR
ncbi:hypothetical protein NBRC10512_007421 [Rhodotorula toruloides]|uniref:RHTO0S12e03444g1_1 n=2 Tax=Rhodotorula toruloides TaxID=5286 RepID=A0A061B8V0_RHOTO|nr:uncharacterized protein RHTO_07529 [Rhodotorula toruloides NP11]EMS23187.1 hypothetical protein RHTO_07529 [Rhodotorula toruloides NP11]CDR46345.1 RHTO0S12e03444g1_1 [Rhodotorula toruloides]